MYTSLYNSFSFFFLLFFDFCRFVPLLQLVHPSCQSTSSMASQFYRSFMASSVGRNFKFICRPWSKLACHILSIFHVFRTVGGSIHTSIHPSVRLVFVRPSFLMSFLLLAVLPLPLVFIYRGEMIFFGTATMILTPLFITSNSSRRTSILSRMLASLTMYL